MHTPEWDFPLNSDLQGPTAEGRDKCGVQQWFPEALYEKNEMGWDKR